MCYRCVEPGPAEEKFLAEQSGTKRNSVNGRRFWGRKIEIVEMAEDFGCCGEAGWFGDCPPGGRTMSGQCPGLSAICPALVPMVSGFKVLGFADIVFLTVDFFDWQVWRGFEGRVDRNKGRRRESPVSR
jgi:hypothetical protein